MSLQYHHSASVQWVYSIFTLNFHHLQDQHADERYSHKGITGEDALHSETSENVCCLRKELSDGFVAQMQGSKKGKKGKVEDDDELDDVEELRKGGFLEGDAATNLAKAAPKLEAKAGDIRIKRTIKFRNANDAIETRVIYYTDKDKVAPSVLHPPPPPPFQR